MKKILLSVAIAAGSCGAFAADGTFAASNNIYDPVSKTNIRQYIFDVNGTTKLAVANGAVQFLINGAVVGAGANNTGIYGFLQAGLFSATDPIVIPNAAGQTVSVTIHVWDKSTAATYELAQISGNYLPAQTVSIVLGGGGTPAAPAASLYPFKSGSLVPAPEPSTYALAALGLGGLLFISRRK